MASWSEKMLQLLRRMNNFHLPGSSLESCLRFEVAGEQVGWIPPKVASILGRFPSVFRPYGSAITFCSSVDTFESRSVAVDEVLQELRREASFTCLIGWRDETLILSYLSECISFQQYAVMPRYCDPPLMYMERAATSLFGVKRYGVHVNGYTRDSSGNLNMWLARRSLTKQTYPGRLDNMAAGGLAAGCSVRHTLVKECEEEACIPPGLAEQARPVGTVSYTYEDDEGIFPECQFVFDLELPLNFQPHIGDGEVQAFYYYPIEKVKDLLVSEEFKPNCAMVVLDFLIRHAIIEPDSEPYYHEFVAGLHRSL
ncbi:thiamin pyrophosphokinase 2 isoform X2 [Ctenopharyngodon idella]|uniref:thiamin pyrophosphokinase 2 isoform X2 n=1 Tax=Ctenopharyngodon idella TaxID=7959 RepID=UPI0022300A43|nr:thiamin pyrophosphokinase 2 isoform X2 [Ctenopharyngodon idella]